MPTKPPASPNPPPLRTPASRSPLKNLAMLGMGAFSLLYLANPGAGIFEFLPDNIPGIGHVDEALAAMLFLRALAYFGINLVGSPAKRRAEPVIDIDPPPH